MRMSCNGCRVLRKGCSENCSIKPCLQWIKTSESQANATVFLAKFYGRAGLLNLINAGPEDLRPAIFRSLLYEACGRIVNPIYGSVGLLWSGSWHLCQSAVESVLRGVPVTKIASEAAVGPPMKACDIRHVSKDENSVNLHKVRAPHRFKRSSGSSKALTWRGRSDEPKSSSPSYDSSVSHPEERESKETESMVSAETAEAPPLLLTETQSVPSLGDADLELSLGFRRYSVST